MKQMEAHKQAKQEEKKHDLEYFELIRKQKEEMAREEKEKRDILRQKVIEQKIVRDQQIQEHSKVKNAARKEKLADYEKLKKLEYELKEQAQRDRENAKQTKERVMNNYNQQIVAKTDHDQTVNGSMKSPESDMLDSLF